MEKIKELTICYAEKQINASCGRRLVHEGAIIKVLSYNEYWDEYQIYLSKKMEKNKDYIYVSGKNLVEAPHLEDSYNNGIRNISQVKEKVNEN